jgi:hypothetical protein
MKHFTLYISLIFCFAVARAERGPNDSSKTSVSKAVRTTKSAVTARGCVRLKFTSHPGAPENKDSALVIFDRYNRTGAGVIFNVFVQDQDHAIIIPQVPAGKYFVTVQCLGLHHDRMEKIITVHAKKGKSINLQLEDAEEFSKDKVVIPAYKPNPMTLGSF